MVDHQNANASTEAKKMNPFMEKDLRECRLLLNTRKRLQAKSESGNT